MFFLKVDGKLAGFAMVIGSPAAGGAADYNMAVFFVMYRRCGRGKWAAFSLVDRFTGLWQLKRTPRSQGWAVFWDKVVGEYTKGDFMLERGRADIAYDDGTPADLFTFRAGR